MSRKQTGALVGAVALMFAYSLTTNALGFFIAPVTADLGYERSTFSLHMTVMIVVSMVTTPFVGQLIRRMGFRRLLLLGGVMGAACFAAFSLCRSLAAFYAVAAGMGLLYYAGTNVSAVIIVNWWFPEHSGVFTGIVMAGTGLGGAVMSAILPSFLRQHSWRVGYLLLAAVWFSLTLLAVFLAGSHPPSDHSGDGEEVAGEPEQGLRLSQISRTPPFYLFLLCVAVLALCGTFVQHMPAYYEEIGLSDGQTAMVMSLFNLVFILAKVLGGVGFDRFGRKLAWVLVSAFAAGFWLSVAGVMAAQVVSMVFLAVGIAAAALLPPLVTTELYGHRYFPAIWGVVSLALNLGKAVGVPAWGAVFDLTRSYRGGIVAAPLLLIGVEVILCAVFRLSGSRQRKKLL